MIGAADDRRLTRRKARYWNGAREHAWMLAPPVAFLAAFLVVPLARVVWASVGPLGAPFAVYARVFEQGFYARSFLYTIQTAFIVTLVCLIAAYPLAYALANARGWTGRLMSTLLLLPLWTSVVIRSYAWLILFQRHGPVNAGLLWLHWVGQPVQILQTAAAVRIGMVHILLPFMVLPLVASMTRVDRTLLRAARVLGATPVRVFLRVYLRLTLPGVLAGCSLVFISALGFYITPALLGGARNATAAMMIEQAVSVFLDWPLASALSTILLLTTIVLYLGYARLTRGELRALVR